MTDNKKPSTRKVGKWAEEKHQLLRSYVEICSGVRKKFLEGSSKTATYIDLFCGYGTVETEEGKEIDGSAVVAWKASQKKQPFSHIFIADTCEEAREDTAEKLRSLGAPVKVLQGDAIEASETLKNMINNDDNFKKGLHFAFLDPYGLSDLDFKIIENLSSYERMDILVHISKAGLQRNLKNFLKPGNTTLEKFIPGWRDELNLEGVEANKARKIILDFWKKKTVSLNFNENEIDAKLIEADGGQKLYWLALIARADCAHKFWKIVREINDPQKSLF